MNRFVIAVSLLTMACVGCGDAGSPAAPSSARPDTASLANAVTPMASAAGAKATVPLEGHLQGKADPPDFEDPPSPYFFAHITAEGRATHLGRFTMDFPHRVNLETRVGTGDAVFIAANGDELRTKVEGTATAGTTFTVTEIHTITGGTGRFARATGQFTITRTASFTDPFTSGDISGRIVLASGGD